MSWNEILDALKLGSIFGGAVFIGIIAIGLGWV